MKQKNGEKERIGKEGMGLLGPHNTKTRQACKGFFVKFYDRRPALA
jgi:hypothetical protein